MKKNILSSHAGRPLYAAAASLAIGASLSAFPIFQPVLTNAEDLINDFDVTGASTITWTTQTNKNQQFVDSGSISQWMADGSFLQDDSGTYDENLTVMTPGYPASFGLYSFSDDFGIKLKASGSGIKTVIAQVGKMGNPDFYDPVNGTGTAAAVLYWNDPTGSYPPGHSPNTRIANETKFNDSTFTTYDGGPVARYSTDNGLTWTVIQSRPAQGILAGKGAFDGFFFASYFSFVYQWDLSGISGSITDVEVAVPNIVHESHLASSITVGTAYVPVLPKSASTTQAWNGGNGNWSSVSWDSGPAVSWTDGNNASFAAADTVTVDTAVTAADLVFTGGATVSGSNTLTSTGYIDVDSGITATVSAPVAGTSGLHKTGTGTLVLSGSSNTFSNGVFVYDGTLKLGSTSAIPAGNRVKLGKDAEIDLNGNNVTISSFQADPGSNINLGTNTLTINTSSHLAANMRGQITGSGNLTLNGGVVYFLEDTPSFTGDMSVVSGATVVIESTIGNGIDLNVGSDGLIVGDGTIDGNLDFSVDGILRYDSSLLKVDGNADLNNATIEVPTAATGNSYTVLSATGTITLGTVTADPVAVSIVVNTNNEVVVTY